MESNATNVTNVEFESTLPDIEESNDFLSSEKRLFNRRGSGEENQYAFTSTSLNVNAPIFVPQKKTFAHSENSITTIHQQRQPRRKKVSTNKRNCLYCKRKGMDAVTVGTHNLRNLSTNEIICPFLLQNM